MARPRDYVARLRWPNHARQCADRCFTLKNQAPLLEAGVHAPFFFVAHRQPGARRTGSGVPSGGQTTVQNDLLRILAACWGRPAGGTPWFALENRLGPASQEGSMHVGNCCAAKPSRTDQSPFAWGKSDVNLALPFSWVNHPGELESPPRYRITQLWEVKPCEARRPSDRNDLDPRQRPQV
jgi:hypothetical protein